MPTKSDRPLAIAKQLSVNDTGSNGTHQAGILVPKNPEILGFFPSLEAYTKNPRRTLVFHDNDGKRWGFSFIYYNNSFFGGTRNEYRLTRMTAYIRTNALVAGDEVVLRRNPSTAVLSITYRRMTTLDWTPSGALKLGASWREIKI